MSTHLKNFDLVGKKEEIQDYITMIAPSDTPFQSSIKSEPIFNTLYQWMEDQLRAVALNAKLEGATPADSVRDQPTMRTNGTQILEETYRISGTSEAVRTYGRDKIAAREMMKTGKLLKMDLEFSLVGNAQTYVVAAAAVAGRFASVQAQIDALTSTAAGGVAINESLIVSTHEKLYNAGSDSDVLMIKPSDSKVIMTFSQASGRSRLLDGEERKITNVINIYESPFGTVRVVKNRRIRATDALFYDAKNWKLAVLRNWFRENLAKIGDSDQYMMVGEFGLKHSHRQASAIITGLL